MQGTLGLNANQINMGALGFTPSLVVFTYRLYEKLSATVRGPT